MRRLGLLMTAVMTAAPAAAEPTRHALVIGNAEYRNLTPLHNTVNDAADIAAALGKLGFAVDRASDTNLDGFERDLAAFASGVKPGDTVIVYFAGHGVTGRTAADAAQTDSFLLPVDIALATPADVPLRSRGLGAILTALERAKAGTKLIILDACRDNPFASIWPADAPGAAGGLVQPVSDTLRGAMVAYATSPGEFAIENSAGRNGLFTQELLKRIATPDTALSVILADVSAAVEYESKGEQIPFFVAGDADAAQLVLKRSSDDAPPVAADPLTVDIRLHREAVECGLAACLESAAVEIRDPGLRLGLIANARSLRGPAEAQSTAPVPAASLPRPPVTLPPAVAAAIGTDRGTVDGVVAIGRRFMLGTNGFPHEPATAFEWYKAAAQAGSGAAAYEVASLLHNGMSGIAKNRVEAYRWLLKAAKTNYPAAYALGGSYRFEGWGGQLKSIPAAMRWFEAGVALGDAGSELALAKLTDETARRNELYRLAAAKGSPEAMFRTALAAGETPMTPALAAKVRQAGEAGYWPAFTRLGDLYAAGDASTPPDRAEAIRWFRAGADRGDAVAMYSLALTYAQAGVANDCPAATLWLRRAATAGDWRAVTALRKGFACPATSKPAAANRSAG